MATVLDLLAPALGNRVPVQRLTDVLGSLTVQSLEPAVNGVELGTLAAGASLPVLPGLPDLPAPAGPLKFALKRFGPPLTPTGFVLDVVVGDLAVDVPGLGAKLRGAIALRIEAAQGSAPITVRAFARPAGDVLSPMPVDLPDLEMDLDPSTVTLADVFDLDAEVMRLVHGGLADPTAVKLVVPEATLTLPWVPGFGRLAVDISDLSIDPANGIAGSTSVVVPHPSLGHVSVDVDWDQPGAVSLNDLVPTRVDLSAALPAGFARPLPAAAAPSPGRLTPQAAGGGTIRIHASLGRDAGGVMRAAMILDAAGSSEGIVLFDDEAATNVLAIAAVLGTGLVGRLPEDTPGAAALAGVIAASIPLSEVAIGGTPVFSGGHVAVQGVRVDAPLGADPEAGVRIDAAASLMVDVGLGPVRIRTRPDGPLRVRYRDIAMTVGEAAGGELAGAAVSLTDVQAELESPGAWEVIGLGDLLRVAGVRNGAGSSWFEIDLVLGIDLGLVRIDQATVRVTLGSGAPDVELRGLGVSITVPGVLEGEGAARIADGEIEAEAAARIIPLNLAAAASFTYSEQPGHPGRPLLKISMNVGFPGPLPLGATGLGLFGLGGLFAMNAERSFPVGISSDPVEREFAWQREGGFAPSAGLVFGADAVIGTIPDLGFAFNAIGSVVLTVPDVAVIVGIDVGFLQSRPPLKKLPADPSIGVSGLMVVDGNGALVGARGTFVVPGLIDARIPVGAFFPFTTALPWFIRIGADGHGNPVRGGGPVALSVLPDLIDLSAWAYLMFEGDGLRDLGGKLQIADHGFAIGFGVGWDIEWVAFPLHFRATGEILVGLATDPWAFVGHAYVAGSLDLGPVSLTLSAAVDVEVGDERPLHAKGKICGYVDLFFFEVGGCIGVEIGPAPAFPIPVPPSPLKECNLVDRLGQVIASVGDGESPVVWPDAVPVLSFSSWIETALGGGPFKRNLVAQPPPPVDGWSGSQDLGYRFSLTKLELTATKDGQTTDVTDDLYAAWSLPKHGQPYGTPDVPAVGGARELNLLTWEDALWARSLLDGGASAPGDPVGAVDGPCADPPAPTCGRLLGVDAHSVSGGFGWGRVSEVWRVRGQEFRAQGRWSVGSRGILDDATAPAHAAEIPGQFVSGGVRFFADVLSTAAGDFAGCWDLPRLFGNPEISDEAHTVVIAPSMPLADASLAMCIDPGGSWRDRGDELGVSVTGVSSEGARVAWPTAAESGQGVVVGVLTARPPDPDDWVAIEIAYRPRAHVGILAVEGCAADGVREAARDRAARDARRDLNTALAGLPLPVGRSLLEPGTTYRLTVGVAWEGRGGTPMTTTPLAEFDERVFTFRTASAEPLPPADASGYLHLLYRRHNAFDAHSLARYVRSFHPAEGTASHFTADPLVVDMSVDYLEQLVGKYEGTLRLRARRVDPPPGSPPFVEPGDDVGLITLFPSFYPVLLDVADVRRNVAALLSPCAVPVGGGTSGTTVVPLDSLAHYELGLVTIPVPGGSLARAVVASALFSTSAYASPDLLLDALWSGPTGDVELRDVDAASLSSLAGAGDAAFEKVLVTANLDPWPAVADTRISRLWIRGAGPEWRLAGMLLEAAEPIDRPGRLDNLRLTGGVGTFAAPIVDTRGTRLAFLAMAPFTPAAGDLVLHATGHEPWVGGDEQLLRSQPMTLAPTWAGELAG